MTEQRVGILIKATDSASQVLVGVGKSAKVAAKGVTALSKSGAAAFKGVGVAGALMNQSLELGKKAIEMFNRAITDTIKHAFEFRKANDPALKQFKELANSAQLLRARIGDALIPVFHGMAKSLDPIVKGMTKWVSINRKLIGSTLIQWLTDAANILTDGIAWGALQVARAWNGWLMIINTVQLAVNTFFEMQLRGVEKALGAFSKLITIVGPDSLGKAFKSAQGFVKGFADEFERSADQNKKDIQGNVNDLDALEKKIGKVKTIVKTAIGEASVNAFKALDESVEGSNQKLKEQTKILEEHEQKTSDWFERFVARKEAERELIERQTQLVLDLQAQHEEKLMAMADNVSGFVMDVGNSITHGIVDAMWAAAEGTASFGKVMANVMKGIGKSIMKAAIDVVAQRLVGMAINALFNVKEVMGAAALASANTFASISAIPMTGPAMAPAAAAASYAQVASMTAMVPMQYGGMVTGGLPGADSVPALLAPKERVLNEREAREYEGMKSGDSSGGGNTININTTIEVAQGTDEDVMNIWIRQWDRVLTEMVGDNALSFVKAI